MTTPNSAEYWDNMADMAELFGVPHAAEAYRRLAGLHRLQAETDRANQEEHRAYLQETIINGWAGQDAAEAGHQAVQQATAYIRASSEPAGTGPRRGEWTQIGWVDEEHAWTVDHEKDGEWGGEVLRRIRNTNHTIDVTFADPDTGRRLALLIGGPRTPRQDYPPATPPYKGLPQAMAVHYGGYYYARPRQAGKAGTPTPNSRHPRL